MAWAADAKTRKKDTKNATHQKTTWLDKKTFISMVNDLKTVTIGTVKDYVVHSSAKENVLRCMLQERIF